MTDEERRLFEECRWLREALVRESNAAVLAQQQLTVVQTRCSQLVEEKRQLFADVVTLRAQLRDLEQSIILPGWTCTFKDCGVFNGEMQQKHETCRACDRPRNRVVESAS